LIPFSSSIRSLLDTRSDPVEARGQGVAVAIVGAALLGLLAVYLYASPEFQASFLNTHVPPQQDVYDERFLVVNAILLLWAPLLFILWGLRAQVEEFGMAPGDLRAGWIMAGLGYAVMLPILVIAARQPEFQATYPLRRLVRVQPGMFLYWELSYGFYFFLWEWFFRGFLLFGLRRGFGRHAVWLQAIPFGLLHWGKPPLEMASAFPGGLLLGLLAWRAESFLPCFALHWAIAASMDGLAVLFRH
jgi:membrane protease YdiL (CAAX protease family)